MLYKVGQVIVERVWHAQYLTVNISIQQTCLSYEQEMMLEHHYSPSSWLYGKGVEVSNLRRLVPNYSEENKCHCFLDKNSST